MTFFNTGVLYASRPFTENALKIIEEILGTADSEYLKVHGNTIDFQDFPSGTLEMKVDEIVDRLGALGIQLEGRIDHDGSYEGAYFWRHGEHHEEKTQAEVAIIDADTEELIQELEHRGFHVSPTQEQSVAREGMEMIQ